MGNHQTNSRRVHRPSEPTGFVELESDDENFVTIQQRQRRISTKSEPITNKNDTVAHLIDDTLVLFSLPAFPFDAYAHVIGSFDGWREHPMTKSDGEYKAQIHVSHGHHQYKFIVNGRSRYKWGEPVENHTQFGRVHSIDVSSKDNFDWTILASHTPNLWSQQMNKRLLSTIDYAPPPRIPPHLLNILLNRKMPIQCEPCLLPEPNRVMLHHLYALSIQNGMMILSTTRRFKRKFVTTCFYKPI